MLPFHIPQKASRSNTDQGEHDAIMCCGQLIWFPKGSIMSALVIVVDPMSGQAEATANSIGLLLLTTAGRIMELSVIILDNFLSIH